MGKLEFDWRSRIAEDGILTNAKARPKGSWRAGFKNYLDAIAAFANDLGPKMADVCLVTMTEFGRTVKENGNGGTDHGHGSVMMALGGDVRGKRVLSHWKSLATENLFEGRDLPITTDFRDVWTSILTKHLRVQSTATVFPGYHAKAALDLFRA